MARKSTKESAATVEPQSVTVTAGYNKTTKNGLYRYQTEVGEDVQASFYVSQEQMGATPAPSIRATVEWYEEEPTIFEPNSQDGF